MYKIICYLVPKRPEIKTRVYIKANTIKECIEILRKEHNIFEETIYKIERTDKKNATKSDFDWTISEFSRYN